MDGTEQAYFTRVKRFILDELQAMAHARAEEHRQIRERNRELAAERPFAAVYGSAEEVRRTNEAGLDEIDLIDRKKQVLERMLDAPYFGRVDFLFDGETQPESMYIGLATLTDFNTGKILVYDWRAPVSALFYTGETGRASYLSPSGEICGEILRIRQYRFSHGVLQAFWDTDLQIDDLILRDVLSGNAAQTMKPIVCTIQREQNQAIRFYEKKNLTVFGPAGCGKTSVGMHRLSWIMYRMQSEGYVPQMLMFTANEAFRAYVTGVLPSLGDREIGKIGFPALFSRYLPGFHVQSSMEQTEALLEDNTGQAENIKRVYAPAFAEHVEREIQQTPLRFRRIVLYGETVVSAEETEMRYRALPANLSVRQRLDTVAVWVKDEIANYFLMHKKEIENKMIDEMEMGDFSRQVYQSARKQCMEDAADMVRAAVVYDPASLYLQYAQDVYGNDGLTQALARRLETGNVFFEDAVLMLYIAVKLHDGSMKKPPDHVLIDEAQDYAPLLHKIIRMLYPKAAFTVLADTNQGIVPPANVSQAQLQTIYDAQTITLKKSYRSTVEIGSFAKRFLPAAHADYMLFERHGIPPQTYVSSEPEKTTAEILLQEEKNGRSVCIILKTSVQAAAFYQKLKRYAADVCLVHAERTQPEGRVFCMPAALTKGLEFDVVIVPYADMLDLQPRVAYLTVTRALHRLHLIFSDQKMKNIY